MRISQNVWKGWSHRFKEPQIAWVERKPHSFHNKAAYNHDQEKVRKAEMGAKRHIAFPGTELKLTAVHRKVAARWQGDSVCTRQDSSVLRFWENLISKWALYFVSMEDSKLLIRSLANGFRTIYTFFIHFHTVFYKLYLFHLCFKIWSFQLFETPP